jgi:rsbT co-antagonist protein RsbR
VDRAEQILDHSGVDHRDARDVDDHDRRPIALNGGEQRLHDLRRAGRVELSTPVIPVHAGVLVLPLVGTLDSARASQIMDSLLGTIQKNGASVVIIDSTGVPTVDTGVIEHLLRTVHAVKLLGARAVLVGISPAIAQTMVQLGVDFGGLTTLGNLQAGVAYALRHIGFEIRARA